MTRFRLAMVTLAAAASLAALLSARTAAESGSSSSRDLLYQEMEETSTIKGEWIYSFNELSITDDSRLFMHNIAINSPFIYLGQEEIITLTIGCPRNRLTITISFQTNFDTNDSIEEFPIEYRIDNQISEQEKWYYSEGLAMPLNPLPLINKLMTADRLIVRASPRENGPVEAVFSLRGLPEALAPLQAACGRR